MDISVIVPIYKGQKYVTFLQKMIEKNIKYAGNYGLKIEVELILVNDYPEEPLFFENDLCVGYEIRIIENSYNYGIQRTRVNGLLQAKGEYILFLDQDDEVFDNCLYSQYLSIGENDIVVGNGYRWINGKYRKIYRNMKKQQLSCKEKFFIKAANQIVSPGHCLIRKDSIPDIWCNNILTKNGADDIFLWLLMFEANKKFCLNYDCVYKHINTGVNLSNDLNAMCCSLNNLINIARTCNAIDEKKLAFIERRIKFLKDVQTHSKKEKVKVCLKNLDICMAKFYAYFR